MHEGKYTLCFQSEFGYQPVYVLLLDYLANVANQKENPVAQAGWKALSYRPEGSFRPKKEWKDDVAAAYLKPAENVPFCYDVVLFHPHAEKLDEKKERELISHIYENMCARIGEEKVWMVINGFDFSSEKVGLQPTEEIATALRQKYEEHFGESAAREEGGSVFPAPLSYGTGGERRTNALPFRDLIGEGVTRCGALSFLDREELDEEPFWLSLASFAYLYVPRRPDDTDNPFQTLGWYLANGEQVPEPLRDPEDTRVGSGAIGFAECGEHGFILDCFVASENKFFRTLRTIAPVLQAYRAKVVLVNQDGVAVYDCGYRFNISE